MISRTISKQVRGALLLGLTLSGLACGVPSDGDSRGVLLIGIDGLRADHLSCYGYDRETTPTLDALAAEGVRFTQMFSSAPVVIPAHISLFTGAHPGVARRFLPGEFEGPGERRWRIPKRVAHLAIEFLASRYATAAFLDSPLLDPVYGFGPGFQVYEYLELARGQRASRTRRLIDRFLTWTRNLDGDKKWFAYLHFHALEDSWAHPSREWERFFEPRPELREVPPVGNTDATFFAVPRSRWGGGARSLGEYEAAYDGHLRQLDSEIERLLGHLRRDGRYENTSIHVIGTHGIQLGEAGLYVSGGRYSLADLSVPWIARPAGGEGAGRKIDALASLVDVPSTLLALEGLAVPGGMHGDSQAARIRGAAAEQGEVPYVFASGGIQEGCAVIGERYCLEYLAPGSLDDSEMRRSWFGERREEQSQPLVRFYDRLNNPFPSLNASTDGPPREELARYRKVLHTWLENLYQTRMVLQPGGRLKNKIDPEEIERLIELGYLGRAR